METAYLLRILHILSIFTPATVNNTTKLSKHEKYYQINRHSVRHNTSNGMCIIQGNNTMLPTRNGKLRVSIDMEGKKAILIALACITITGCKLHQHCDAYSDQQCDELYPYYNCDHPQMYSYTPRNYRKHTRAAIRHNSYTPGYNGYYPNTQTIYYTPVYMDQNCDDSRGTTRRPRPSSLGGDPNNSGNNVIERTPSGVHRNVRNNSNTSRKNRD